MYGEQHNTYQYITYICNTIYSLQLVDALFDRR